MCSSDLLEKLKMSGQVVLEEVRKAFYSEMDLNGHMNNSHYIRWAVDMLPMEVLTDYEIAEFEINYNASITFGKQVKLTLAKDDEGAYIVAGDDLETQSNYFMAKMTLRARA